MFKKTINTQKTFKISAIIYAAVILIGIVFTVIGGVKLDINFSGGTRLAYTYEGEVATKDFEATVKTVLKKDFTVSNNISVAGDTKTFTINLAGSDSLDNKTQQNILSALNKKFTANSFEVYSADSVSPTVAGSFLLKSLFAMLVTAVLVVIYVGFRFRNIGGVSASLTAFVALALDLAVAFFTCVIFRLQIDSNFMAVVITILGYSLNDTIVVYDRIRESHKYDPQLELSKNIDMSIASVMTRNIITTVTTILAILTIIVVSEIYGITSLRAFAIPMTFGMVSGCVSSLFIAPRLWVIWRNFIDSKKKA